MSKRNQDPCLAEIKKPMLPTKQLDIIFRRRRLPNTQYYFTDRKHALPESGEPYTAVRSFRIPRSQKLLSYIKYCDRNEKIKFKAQRALPVHLKDNFKLAATRDRSQRLYIKEEPDPTLKTVVDLHPEFYGAIEGRPLRYFDDIKVYIRNIRNYAMCRQQIGYRRDMLLKLVTDEEDEKKEYKSIALNFKFHLKHFQQFINDDYRLAQIYIAKAEKLHEELQEKMMEYVGYAVKLSIISNNMYKIDSERNVLKMYRSFLMFMAPMYWREVYDERYRVCVNQSVIFQVLSEEFSHDDDVMLGGEIYIDKIVEAFKTESKNFAPPYMYFKHPDEISYLFRTLELQSREYLVHLRMTHDPYRLMQNRMKILKESTRRELEYSQFYIDMLEKEIMRESANEIDLQDKFMRILNQTFYDTVASPGTLKLKICLEFVYEQIFGKSEEGAGPIRDAMKLLEGMYENYSLRLDNLDFESVTQATKDCFREDLAMMRTAHLARRELNDFTIMSNAIDRAFMPPAKFKRPEIKKFLDKKALAALKREAKKKAELESGERKQKVFKVTREQRENLLFFTYWCEGTDPAPFLKQIETYVTPTLEMPTQDLVVIKPQR